MASATNSLVERIELANACHKIAIVRRKLKLKERQSKRYFDSLARAADRVDKHENPRG